MAVFYNLPPDQKKTMDSEITIRPACIEDAATITAFQLSMAMETEGLELDGMVLHKGVSAVFEDSRKGSYWIAEADGMAVASLMITREWSDWRNAWVWWFQSVYVVPAYRRKGVFRIMYDHIRREACMAGAAGLRLYVESTNTTARKTYEAMGMSGSHYTTYEWLRD